MQSGPVLLSWRGAGSAAGGLRSAPRVDQSQTESQARLRCILLAASQKEGVRELELACPLSGFEAEAVGWSMPALLREIGGATKHFDALRFWVRCCPAGSRCIAARRARRFTLRTCVFVGFFSHVLFFPS